jgi:hypothetical protein
MREDIAGGLKNALDKGENLEKAIRSFINAGYSEKEVRDAASYASEGTLKSLQKITSKDIKKEKPIIKKLEKQTISQNPKSKRKSKISGKIILLGGALLILAGILVSTLFFREQILAFFTEKF